MALVDISLIWCHSTVTLALLLLLCRHSLEGSDLEGVA